MRFANILNIYLMNFRALYTKLTQCVIFPRLSYHHLSAISGNEDSKSQSQLTVEFDTTLFRKLQFNLNEMISVDRHLHFKRQFNH